MCNACAKLSELSADDTSLRLLNSHTAIPTEYHCIYDHYLCYRPNAVEPDIQPVSRLILGHCIKQTSCAYELQVQQIWVGALHSKESFTVRAGQVLVQLLEQDLCTAVAIGDVVDIVGQASVNSQPGKANSKLLGDAQVCIATTRAYQLM